MSHYSVAVITRKKPTGDMIDEIMKPYEEDLVVSPYIKETKEQYLVEKRKEYEYYRTKGCYAKYIENPEEYAKDCKNEGHIEYLKNFMNLYNMSDEELLEERRNSLPHEFDEDLEYGNSYLDKNENLICYYNKDAKWDWYVIGGRWDNFIDLKSGSSANSAQIKDIDFHLDIDELIKKYRDEYDKLFTEEGLYSKEYLMERYPTIEDYVKSNCRFSTYAFVTQNGIWKEPGHMGWFGCSSASVDEEKDWHNNYYDNLIKELNPEWYITIVDCHI